MDPAALPDILEAYRNEPFEWGKCDCCLFSANVVRDLTGKDFARGLRSKYRSKTGALKLIAEYGSLEKLLDETLGAAHPAMLARRGDFVLADVPEPALGVCDGARAIFKGEDSRLVAVPLGRCIKSWRAY
jgi:hypothetical protein